MSLIIILTFLIKVTGASFLLYFVYILLLRYKVSYNICRIYLISIPIIALIASIFTFQVLPIKQDLVNEEAKNSSNSFDGFIENNVYLQSEILEISLPQSTPSDIEVSAINVLKEQEISTADIDNTASIKKFRYVVLSILSLSVLFALIKLILLSIQIKNILSIRKWSTKETHNGTIIYRSGLIDGPFSFLRDIYVARSIEGDKLNMIIEHEKSHVSNYHYIDKFIIEILSVCMWFNPAIWIIRNEIGEVHEFQADNNVVKAGVDIKSYKLYLFEEIATSSPIIANGFNHSMIKKRLITLGLNNNFSFTFIRVPLAFSAMLITFIYLSCVPANSLSKETVAADNVVLSSIIDLRADDNDRKSLIVADTTQVLLHDIEKTIPSTVLSKVKLKEDKIADRAINKNQTVAVPDSTPKKDSIFIKNISDTIAANANKTQYNEEIDTTTVAQVAEKNNTSVSKIESKKDKENGVDWYDLPIKSIRGLPDYILYDKKKKREREIRRIIGIKHSSTETFVDFVLYPRFDWWWCIFTSRTFLKNRSTNDLYQIRRIEHDVPLDRFLVIKGHKNRCVTFTLVFPRLAENVKMIDFIEHKAPGIVYPPDASAGGSFTYYDIDVKKFEESAKIKSTIIK